MEPRKSEEPLASAGEGRTSPPAKEKKRRFQIIKLEERIAPGGGHSYYFCYKGNNGSQGLGKGCLK